MLGAGDLPALCQTYSSCSGDSMSPTTLNTPLSLPMNLGALPAGTNRAKGWPLLVMSIGTLVAARREAPPRKPSNCARSTAGGGCAPQGSAESFILDDSGLVTENAPKSHCCCSPHRFEIYVLTSSSVRPRFSARLAPPRLEIESIYGRHVARNVVHNGPNPGSN